MKYLIWAGYLLLSIAAVALGGGVLAAVVVGGLAIAAIGTVIFLVSFAAIAIKDYFENR